MGGDKMRLIRRNEIEIKTFIYWIIQCHKKGLSLIQIFEEIKKIEKF